MHYTVGGKWRLREQQHEAEVAAQRAAEHPTTSNKAPRSSAEPQAEPRARGGKGSRKSTVPKKKVAKSEPLVKGGVKKAHRYRPGRHF